MCLLGIIPHKICIDSKLKTVSARNSFLPEFLWKLFPYVFSSHCQIKSLINSSNCNFTLSLMEYHTNSSRMPFKYLTKHFSSFFLIRFIQLIAFLWSLLPLPLRWGREKRREWKSFGNRTSMSTQSQPQVSKRGEKKPREMEERTKNENGTENM